VREIERDAEHETDEERRVALAAVERDQHQADAHERERPDTGVGEGAVERRAGRGRSDECPGQRQRGPSRRVAYGGAPQEPGIATHQATDE
jgi:hypothetical protein